MEKFKYTPCIPVSEWGCHFDSMLELKYALSIQDDYEFLRSRIPIFYNPKTKIPTDFLRYNTKRYTPDFLIRHKITGKASWVEIKPRAFENQQQLITRTQLAERFIQWKQYDWQFKIVYDDEIHLKPYQQQIYNAYYRSKRKWLAGCNPTAEKTDIPTFEIVITDKKVRFVIFGEG